MSTDSISRRTALKYAGVITLAAQGGHLLPSYAATVEARGYGTDPDLLNRTVTWPRTLTVEQLKALAALCEIVLPAEPPHPSAAQINVQEFLDEWLSAPYPQMRADREAVLRGLEALDSRARGQNFANFGAATATAQAQLFDAACGAEATVAFARRLIELICAGYYTTREGHAAIGYVGNVGLTAFPEPPPEIVRRLEQALKELPARNV